MREGDRIADVFGIACPVAPACVWPESEVSSLTVRPRLALLATSQAYRLGLVQPRRPD